MPRYPQAMLASCEIPWSDDERLLEDVFRREIRHILHHFNHLYIFGTAGEGYAVDTPLFRRIVQIFYEETRGEAVHPMVGVIALSTATTLERLAIAYNIGFRTFQIVLPSWGEVNDVEVMTYFKDVCGSFPDCRFLHYNLPRARRVLEGEEYARLIEAIPNLVATKTTSGGLPRVARLMRHASELQHFFGEANFPHGCLYGECSLLSSWGPVAPHKAREFFKAGLEGNVAQLFTMQRHYHDLITDVLSPLRTQPYMDGAYDKLLVRLGGFEEMPLRLLSPYQSLSEAQYQVCKSILYDRYPDWRYPDWAARSQ